MSLERDLGFTAADRVFYDTDKLLIYTIWQGEPTQAQIDAGQAVPEDVTGWDLAWVMRAKPSSPDPPLIEKFSAGSPADIAITGVYNVSPGSNTQRVEVTLHDTDTYDPDASPAVNLKPKIYHYALKRLNDGAETILAFGKLKLSQAAAWE